MTGRYRRLSAAGASALSIWELRAPAPELLAAIGVPALPPVDRPRLVSVAAGETLVDQGLLWLRRQPREGQEAEAELHLHGGQGVAVALTEHLGRLGWARQAPPPDEDRARFLGARSPLAARAFGALLDGDLDRRIAALAAAPPAARPAGARELLAGAAWAERLEAPPLVALAGPANAGKSSLFNAWLEEERVTVSPHPGTTRDAVEAGVLLGEGPGAFEVRLVDTAGLWAAEHGLDQEAVAATARLLDRAEFRIWVLDLAAAPPEPVRDRLGRRPDTDLVLVHRDDLAPAWAPPAEAGWLRGSVQREGVRLIRRLERGLLAAFGPVPEPEQLLPVGPQRRARLQALLGDGGGRR